VSSRQNDQAVGELFSPASVDIYIYMYVCIYVYVCEQLPGANLSPIVTKRRYSLVIPSFGHRVRGY